MEAIFVDRALGYDNPIHQRARGVGLKALDDDRAAHAQRMAG